MEVGGVIGKKIAGKDEDKIRLLVGITKSACENMGGTYAEINGRKVCVLKIRDSNEFKEVISRPDVEVIDVGSEE